AAVQQRWNNIDGKAVPLAFYLEKIRRAGAIGAEMKVEADRRAADGEAVDKNALDEIFGSQFGKVGVEGQHNRAVEPGGGEQAQFGGFGSEPEQWFIGIEEGTRMRLEGERSRRLAEHARPRQGRRDHRLVAAMHPVEIADSDRRAAERFAGREIVHHLKVLYGHRRLTTPVRASPRVAR